MLIIAQPPIAQPPIVPKNPAATLANSFAKHSRFGRLRVSVISSIRLSVISVTINPIAARIALYGKITRSEAMSYGINGIAGGGRLPAILAMSPTVRVSSWSAQTAAVAPRMPTNPAGIARVNHGKKYIVAITPATIANME